MGRRLSYTSPVGMLTIAANDEGITALVFDGQKYMELHLSDESRDEIGIMAANHIKTAEKWLDAYFAGKRPNVSELALAPKGSDFYLRVWGELLGIPYGETVTYGDIARTLGTSPRAVGGAVGHNPISIIIPCHRVLGAKGAITGYAGGIEKKEKLLELEGASL